jgi:hypothetical protein
MALPIMAVVVALSTITFTKSPILYSSQGKMVTEF